MLENSECIDSHLRYTKEGSFLLPARCCHTLINPFYKVVSWTIWLRNHSPRYFPNLHIIWTITTVFNQNLKKTKERTTLGLWSASVCSMFLLLGSVPQLEVWSQPPLRGKLISTACTWDRILSGHHPHCNDHRNTDWTANWNLWRLVEIFLTQMSLQKPHQPIYQSLLH